MNNCSLVKFSLLSMFIVSQSVYAANCSITLRSGVNFGSYDPLSHVADLSTGSLVYSCNNPIFNNRQPNPVSISLTQGNSNSYNRFMLHNNERLYYNLYLDSGRQLIWGNGIGNTAIRQLVASSISSQTIPIYAKIPASQNVSAGTYNDLIVVNVNY